MESTITVWETCTICNGSGEGNYDGSTCYHCAGKGQVPVEYNDEPKEKKVNKNVSKEIILNQIKKYGPVNSEGIASSLKIPYKRVQQAVSYLRMRNNINIQKQGSRKSPEYFFDPKVPYVKGPIKLNTSTEDIEEEEETKLFESLISPEQDTITPKVKKGLDLLVNRCHHLILALENCSSIDIMEAFNIDEESARVLVNKVLAKFSGISLSFSVHVIKEKQNANLL